MKQFAVLAALLVAYLSSVFPLSHHLQNKPFLERVGYIPQPAIMKAITTDQRYLAAASLVSKVMVYYGSLVQKNRVGSGLPPDHETMHNILVSASRLDPYNMDTYYFSQAMAWDFKKIKETTDLLEYGMQYRDWDFYLPFFAGFDYAYFLKDYSAAAKHYATAARLSGSDLFGRLASRYMYEAGRTDLAINYLAVMMKNSNKASIKKSFERRLNALREVKKIESARDRYKEKYGHLPVSIEKLYSGGFLTAPVIDPYGGNFYIESDGAVRSTSKFAEKNEQNK